MNFTDKNLNRKNNYKAGDRTYQAARAFRRLLGGAYGNPDNGWDTEYLDTGTSRQKGSQAGSTEFGVLAIIVLIALAVVVNGFFWWLGLKLIAHLTGWACTLPFMKSIWLGLIASVMVNRGAIKSRTNND